MSREILFLFYSKHLSKMRPEASAGGNEFVHECLILRDVSTLLTICILKNMDGHHSRQRIFDVFLH